MKKNLLAITMLVVTSMAYAQDTYIGDKAVVKVQPNTLFYNGGNVSIAPNTQITGTSLTEIVKNQGYIEIAKDYTNTIVDSKGAEFINIYTDNTNYGQVIIKGTNTATTGKLTMEKKSVKSSDIQQFPMAFPFQGNVTDIMYSFEGKTPSNFRGNCAEDTRCSQRYWMTLFYWDNNKIVNAAVPTTKNLIPGGYYLLNIIPNTGLDGQYDGLKIVDYKGQPAPDAVEFTGLKTVAPNIDGFEGLGYNSWKSKINAYNETYWSYLGNINSTSVEFGKNIFRFGNPYTSNLDLTNPSTWMNLSNLPFELTKLSPDYKHTWNTTTGSSHNSVEATQFTKAIYENGVWSGNGEATLLRPLEMFQVEFSESSLVSLNINLNDDHKTFNQTPLNITQTSPKSQGDEFHQLKISLIDNDNNIAAEPVYLASSIKFKSGKGIKPSQGSLISLIEEDIDGNVIANAKTQINRFNDNYVGKPLRLEINGLPVGNSYKMRFNLKENNIFTNDVNNFSNGSKFYLHDKLKDTYTEINGNTSIDINISDKSLDQYSFYWKETPKTLNVTDLDNKFNTQVYKFAKDNYQVRLDSSKKSANIEIYSISGSKIADQLNINISNSSDVKLNIPSGSIGLYIIKVTYDDGSNKNLKVLVD